MFHCIYLAAGFSRRYGSNKLNDICKGKKMYRHVLDRLLEILKEGRFPIDLTVVTQYEEILKETEKEGIACAVNPDPSRGISSSLQTGVEYLEKRNLIRPEDYLVFFVADQPKLAKETIENFLTAVEYAGQPYAAVSAEGQLGNPCAFAADKIPELMALKGDRGGKKILLAHPEEVLSFEDLDPAELEDLDYQKHEDAVP